MGKLTPNSSGRPHYDPIRGHAVKVKLEPGRSYAFWLNSDNFTTQKIVKATQPFLPVNFSNKSN